MDPDGMARAARFVAQQLGERRQDERWLVHATGLNPDTISDFIAGLRWPRTKTRDAIEDAFNLERGKLKAIALGWDRADEGDPIEAAIDNSAVLTRAQKLRLRAFYVEMLEGSDEEVKGA